MDTHTERQFLTSLINSISTERIPDPINSNPLKAFTSADSNIRQIFLTLHILYPNELLPALDLLDRGLIYHLHTHSSQEQDSPLARRRIYHVRSAQEPPTWQRRQQHHHSHRTSLDDTTVSDEMRTDAIYYETRPWAWNCSCPAFAFAAFPSNHNHQSPVNGTNHANEARARGIGEDDGEQRKWNAGGLMKGVDVPICKHLLACVLVEHCGGWFGRFVKEREVSLDEVVAWGAGWGG